MSSQSFKLLSCDGGGIRGLITSLLIQNLEQDFGVIGKADGFAGTSTGGLISLGLANGVNIDDIVNIYQNEGSTIFKPNGWFDAEVPEQRSIPESVEEVDSGPGIFSCQYTNTGVESIAKKLLGSNKISDSKKFLAVNTARLWDNDRWDGVTLSNTAGNPYRDIKMADAALATSAAPTYFPPYEIGSFGFFADGGTFANNPAMTGVSEALHGGAASSLDDVLVLSLGTGENPLGIPPSAIPKPLNWGVNHWLWPAKSGKVPAAALLNMTLDFTASTATRIAEQLLGNHFCRGNFVLTTPVALDDWKQAGELVTQTKAYMKTQAWQDVRTWVKNNWN